MLKLGTVILGRFLQQIFFILVLSVLVVFVLGGLLIYPSPDFFQMGEARPIHNPIQVPFLMRSENRQG
jgi:ATP/ADP translocase